MFGLVRIKILPWAMCLSCWRIRGGTAGLGSGDAILAGRVPAVANDALKLVRNRLAAIQVALQVAIV